MGPSKFRNYDPLKTTRVHVQLNYKRKLQVDQGAFHQAFCQCFSLTNLLSANQMQGFQ